MSYIVETEFAPGDQVYFVHQRPNAVLQGTVRTMHTNSRSIGGGKPPITTIYYTIDRVPHSEYSFDVSACRVFAGYREARIYLKKLKKER